MPVEPITVEGPAGPLSADLTRPDRSRAALLLAHGAGAGYRQATMVALGEALAGLCEADEDVGMRIAGEWLASSDEGTRELAALALGQTRLDAAVPLLRRAAERAVRARERRTFWVALGTLRLEGAQSCYRRGFTSCSCAMAM